MTRIADLPLPPEKRSEGFKPSDEQLFPYARAIDEPAAFVQWARSKKSIVFDESKLSFKPGASFDPGGWAAYADFSGIESRIMAKEIDHKTDDSEVQVMGGRRVSKTERANAKLQLKVLRRLGKHLVSIDKAKTIAAAQPFGGNVNRAVENRNGVALYETLVKLANELDPGYDARERKFKFCKVTHTYFEVDAVTGEQLGAGATSLKHLPSYDPNA